MTNDEKAEYYDQWHEYFEPLARVRREVVNAVKYYKENNSQVTEDLLIDDPEIKPEIDNLIQTMLNEIESNDT